jgi:phosphoribosylanthranilate isomerase
MGEYSPKPKAQSPKPKANKMKIKICGMKYPENIIEVGALLPDYMGFIFWEKSVRYFDGEMPFLPETIKKVGVFVNENIETILAKAKKYNLQVVQLHGEESVGFCLDLKQRLEGNGQIIKVFSVGTDFDFEVLKPYENVVDFFLFDTKGKLPGGNGFGFDWDILKDYTSEKPFFLSGGIGIADIEKIKVLHLPIHAIDVNSKFEITAGLKDVNKVRTICELLQQ